MADSPEPQDDPVVEEPKLNESAMPDSPWNEQLEKDAWNLEVWRRLQGDVERKRDPEVFAQFYERLLWQFPTSVFNLEKLAVLHHTILIFSSTSVGKTLDLVH